MSYHDSKTGISGFNLEWILHPSPSNKIIQLLLGLLSLLYHVDFKSDAFIECVGALQLVVMYRKNKRAHEAS